MCMAVDTKNGVVQLVNGARLSIVPYRAGRIFLALQNDATIASGAIAGIRAPIPGAQLAAGLELDPRQGLVIWGEAAEAAWDGIGTGTPVVSWHEIYKV